MNILLTGGTGYIGSHLAAHLTEAGHRVCLYDNLSNSRVQVVHQLEALTGQSLSFVKGDVRDVANLSKVMQHHAIEAVIHLAGLKSVAQSTQDPLSYYENNVQGTLGLLRAMQAHQVKTLIFSSSATVYGLPQYSPIDELHPAAPQNPYGQSKHQVEQILEDLVRSDPSWRVISLRYFNPVGAHESGLIAEAPQGTPDNLMPYLLQVASHQREILQVYGDDYDTVDGTGVRDYIHVMDLAEGHGAALQYAQQQPGYKAINLGTGRAHSVLEVLKAFEKATGQTIPYKITARRAGDVASSCASPQLAKKLLKWQAKRSLELMCQSAWQAEQARVSLVQAHHH